jgi:hypothetical protein
LDLGPKGTTASAGLRGELGAILAGTLGLALPLVLGAVTVGIAASARRRRLGFGWAIQLLTSDQEAALAWRERPGPTAPALTAVILSFVLFGLGPVIGGAVVGTWRKLEAFDVMTRAAPGAKLAIYTRAQSAAGQIFESGYLAAMVGVVCVAIGAAILAWLTSPTRARRRILGRPAPMPPSSDGGVIGAAALVVAALGLVVVASPMRRENQTPWPNGSATERLGVETVALEGPDPLVLAPMVALTKTGLAFEREATDIAGVGDRLLTYRENFPLLHPGEPTPREVLLACSPEIASERVFAVLETARRSGYDHVRLVFETALTSVRPAIGTVKLRNVTAAQVAIGDEGAAQAGAQPVRAGDTVTCQQLAVRVVDLRRAGRPVILVSRRSPI